MYTVKLEGKIDNIPVAIDFIKESLGKYRAKDKQIVKTMLISEEVLATMLSQETTPETFVIKVYKKMTVPTVRIEAAGSELKGALNELSALDMSLEEIDSPNAVAAIRNILFKANSERITFKYKNDYNVVTIISDEPSRKRMALTISALVMGLIIGLLMRFLIPSNVVTIIDTNLLTPIKTIFLNLLKMIMAPLIFFSIAACIGTITDVSEVGKIGGKIMLFYMFTTVIAICLGLAFYFSVAHIELGQLSYLVTGEVTEEAGSINFLDTVLDFFPDNMMGAFVNSNTMQIIVIALLTGLATIKMGDKGVKVAAFLDTANDLFCNIASIITRFIPLMVFAAMCSMTATLDLSVLKGASSLIIGLVLASMSIVLVYGLLATFLAGENLFGYLKKIFGGWINAFSLSSSSAAMPLTMKVCDEELGIKPNVYSFSIPLGATINMDGVSIMLSMCTLFFARGFGITFGIADYVTLFLMVVILSMGCPGIPGACLLVMSVLLAQFNIPMEAMALFLPINVLIDPIATADNVLGDITGTYIVAKRTGNVK